MTETAKIYIIDDDPGIRHSLSLLLTTMGYNVDAFQEASTFLKSVDPSVNGCVLTDVRMPDMTGIDLLDEMAAQKLMIPVVVMTAFADVALAVEAMKKGAIDFIEKPFSVERLFPALQQALEMSRGSHQQTAAIAGIEKRLESLTAREREVLMVLLKGRPNKVIAHQLGISQRTVETHRAKIMEKMQAASLSELVRMCLQVPDLERG